MFRNKSVNVHQFSMIPRADIPRSRFNMQTSHKTTFDAGYLIPIYVDEVLPGDTFNLRMTAFARMSTPIFPIMDNLYLDTFFFFVPNRLVWDNWAKFMGEQRNPGDSTSYIIPQCVMPTGGPALHSLFDYMGIPTSNQIEPTSNLAVNALPFRAYNLIWQEWFRDENLQGSPNIPRGDGPDAHTDYPLLYRGKRHDYFTSCLPWPQKGTSVNLPLGQDLPIKSNGLSPQFTSTVAGPVNSPLGIRNDTFNTVYVPGSAPASDSPIVFGAETGLFADLSEATAATINQLRQAFQIQKLLERDARGGTRYTEILRAHFGVISPDARLQRPEYLGGGSSPVTISPIAQTSGTGTYTDTPQGNLSAIGQVVAKNHGFSQSFTEHGFIIGLACVRADLNYQQGLRRMWSRSTRYDFYFPAFAMLGEQAVLQKEIYCTGTPADDLVFGYQERWAEYRYNPSMITGLFNSTAPLTLDAWHLAQHFTTAPTLSDAFIRESPPLERVLAIGAEAGGSQFIFDSFFSIRAARPMPMYSVPGLIDHF
ncbi:MAG: major capsid protein [Microviridae sp.]|nr:MAG: major capsid protein [Microviridae sp.]